MKRLTVNPGDRFGSLTVLGEAETRLFPSGQKKRYVACRCELCSSEIETALASLNKITQCVDCARKEWGHRRTKHGKCRSDVYNIYHNMLKRCSDPKDRMFDRYGGRGIKVCDRWLGENGFINFLSDIGERPSKQHSLDRYPDKDGDYTSENCRWATARQQAQNTSNNVFYTLGEETMCLAEWARRLKCNPQTLADRRKKGWSDERILTTPIRRI